MDRFIIEAYVEQLALGKIKPMSVEVA